MGDKNVCKGSLSGAIISVYTSNVEGIWEECLNKNTQYLLLRIFFIKERERPLFIHIQNPNGPFKD